MNELITINTIERQIFVIRGKRVMIDRDLAKLYEVQTKRLNEAVKRNIKRFPIDFMFQINKTEFSELVANCDRFKSLKHSSSMPYAFTEYGVAMLSSVLNSEKAISINVEVIKAFIRLRQYAIEHKDLSQRIDELESYIMTYAKENNQEIERINQALNYLIDVTKPSQIGFKTE